MRAWVLRAVSILVALAAWQGLSRAMPPQLLPPPLEAISAFWDNVQTGAVFYHLGFTLVRVAAGLALAMIVGVPVGILMGLSAGAEKVIDVWLVVTLAVPSLCYGLICFIVFGLNDVGAIAAIAATGAPSIAINVWEGVKGMDLRLTQMAASFRADKPLVLRQIILPQLAPYIMASLRYGLGLIWKIAVVVELLGLPNGVGFQLYYWYQLADMRQVLAWTLVFTIVMLFTELLIFKQIERRLFAWRPQAAR